eukprot:763558-Hanusia_phi.AAC.1
MEEKEEEEEEEEEEETYPSLRQAFAGYPLRSFASDRAGVSWQGERSSSWQEEREGLHAGRGGEGAAEDGEVMEDGCGGCGDRLLQVRRSEKRRGEDGEEAAARMREEEGRLPRSFAKIVRRMGRELGMPDSKLVLNISEESLKELEHELHQHVTDARKFKENYERMLEISQNSCCSCALVAVLFLSLDGVNDGDGDEDKDVDDEENDDRDACGGGDDDDDDNYDSSDDVGVDADADNDDGVGGDDDDG